jgi:hypothetical protein
VAEPPGLPDILVDLEAEHAAAATADRVGELGLIARSMTPAKNSRIAGDDTRQRIAYPFGEAYRRCRQNRGAAGVDAEAFDDIEALGLEQWLGNLRQELTAKQYTPSPLRRVWIPKSNGGQRPLGIPTIRDRVVQMAVLLVLGPIFEADLLDEQYGFREGLDAKTAVRRVYFHLRYGRREVVDGDLRDYFNAIPHGPLMKSVARRVADGTVLSVIKSWLSTPVVERTTSGEVRTTIARTDVAGRRKGEGSPLCSRTFTSAASLSRFATAAWRARPMRDSSTTPTTSSSVAVQAPERWWRRRCASSWRDSAWR